MNPIPYFHTGFFMSLPQMRQYQSSGCKKMSGLRRGIGAVDAVGGEAGEVISVQYSVFSVQEPLITEH
jgi:hypothetical protein